MRIAHISDLHFGRATPRSVQILSDEIRDRAADYVIVTGDLTQSGRRRELDAAAEFVRQLPGRVLVVAGNHDVPVRNLMARAFAPFGRFRQRFGELSPSLVDTHVAAFGLNSARAFSWHWDWSRGRLSARQIDEVSVALRRAQRVGLRLVALHHPVILSESRAGRNLVHGASEAMSAWAAAGVDLVLQGHAHLPRLRVIDASSRSIIALQAGSSLGARLRGERGAYNLLEWSSAGDLSVEVRALDVSQYVTAGCTRLHRSAWGWQESRSVAAGQGPRSGS